MSPLIHSKHFSFQTRSVVCKQFTHAILRITLYLRIYIYIYIYIYRMSFYVCNLHQRSNGTLWQHHVK